MNWLIGLLKRILSKKTASEEIINTQIREGESWFARTDGAKKITSIYKFKDDGSKEIIATISHDFVLAPKDKLPLKAEIFDAKQKVIGYIETFYENSQTIRVFNENWKRVGLGSAALAEFSKDVLIKFNPSWEKDGVYVGCGLGDVRVFCFEKDGEIAGLLMNCRESDLLKFFPLVIRKRIESQELVKKLLV